ncbi:MAG: hypothetical protein KKA90_03650 [Nanoarchaeota archaeon]|nr:hypothetical protein [Nanoarchaeota archaeon]
MRVGQTEFFAILGIIIVAVVVIAYAFLAGDLTPSPVPSGVAEKQRTVEATIENVIHGAVIDTLQKLSRNGGLLTPTQDGVSFLGRKVTYWSKQGAVSIPPVESNFRVGVADYLEANLPGAIESLTIPNVVTGSPLVDSTIRSGEIAVTVQLPVSVEGYAINKPFSVTVPTAFGEVLDFAEHYVTSDKQKTYLAHFTIISMALSPLENKVQTTPLLVTTYDCSDHITKTYDEFRTAVEERIAVTLAHTYLPNKVPQNTFTSSASPKYGLPEINGKIYEALDVSFHLPDGFSLNPSTFQVDPNTLVVIPELVPLTGKCRSDPILVKYSMTYPAIVRVKDSLTDNIFQFAVDVTIKENTPDLTATIVSPIPEEQQALCASSLCYSSITVSTTDGSPIKDATVTYLGCTLGKTDATGTFSNLVPCGVGPLRITAANYEDYLQNKDPAEIVDVHATLQKQPSIRLNFYDVFITNNTVSETYQIFTNDINPIRTKYPTEVVHLFLESQNGKHFLQEFGLTSQITVPKISPGQYFVNGLLLDEEDFTMYGAMTTNYQITEDLDGKDLYVYLPYYLGFSFGNEQEAVARMIILSEVLKRCGIGPVLEAPFPANKACTVTWAELDA